MNVRIALLTFSLILPTLSVRGADVIPPARERFAADDAAETPEFRRHIVPLMGKLGCNGRACHGSFQGQGGFRLSLFGYDFKMDHEGLTERLDLESPADSYALQKPTLVEPHEGGKRLDVGSWEYRMLLNWVKGEAKPYDAATHADFVQLHVEPKEIVFNSKGETTQLSVIVEWSDGSRENVTTLSRFSSNNDQVAMIDKEGLVTSNETGDTHVVVYYDNGVVPIPVLRPVTELVGPKYPQVPTSTKVDELVVQKLTKMGIVPSDLCGDAEFLRRVSLDITGTLPTADEVKAFIADSDSQKRAKKIDELLERPGYSAWWTTKLCDWTGNNENLMNNVIYSDRSQAGQYWYHWIHDRVAQNKPYDEIIAGIVVSSSRDEGESLRDLGQAYADIISSGDLTKFADRETMPLFWARQNTRQPTEKARLAFAYSFMGVRIQCAECHKHPFDQWTQDDYNEFTKFFTRVSYGQRDRDEFREFLKELGVDASQNGNLLRRELNDLAKEGKAAPVQQEVFVTPANRNNDRRNVKNRNRNNNRIAPSTARLLGGEEVNLGDADDPRAELMEWLRAKDNPYFAKAFVNRVWANYFNVGIVEPPDDLNLANPPSNAPLLDWLAAEFIERDFDMKWLHREICNSDTYQRSWDPNETNRLDERNFSRAVPRRLPAEVAVDAIAAATASDEKRAAMVHEMQGRSIGYVSNRGAGASGYSLDVFGRSTRESNCDCDRSMESSLLQTIYIRNDTDLNRLMTARDSWVSQVLAELNPKAARQDDKPEGNRQLQKLAQQLQQAEERLDRVKERQPDSPRIKDAEKQVDDLRKAVAKERKNQGLDREKPKVEAVAEFDAEGIATRAYLRTLSRYPNSEELASSAAFLKGSEDLRAGLEGLVWALLNTKEFIVNH